MASANVPGPGPSSSNSSSNEIQNAFPLEGGCECRYIRYRMVTKPLIVHCCHCHRCQRVSGSAFAMNAMIEANRIVHLGPQPELKKVSEGHTLARCPKCYLVVWSNYDGPLLRFVKVGTLDNPGHCPPDMHIYTASKQPWVVLPEGTPASKQDYEREEVWSKESMERWDIFWEKIRIWEAKQEESSGS